MTRSRGQCCLVLSFVIRYERGREWEREIGFMISGSLRRIQNKFTNSSLRVNDTRQFKGYSSYRVNIKFLKTFIHFQNTEDIQH